ncbi:nucleotide-binding universal stress UspA family protein [Mariniflexile fucanivorans]|uniref:Nucleotide-binding universal stress UspA family protein n=1 Tax=Mariniflexile fucanivorans TaxID=264023 RepID=A0A4R1RFG6_9FLAO|nr:universal stress protein [Mariniflexile fucanivorans]TCL64400.1 nucleotide-binding universal stress UspA family protein [Mariniflexile fucanivorans]
MKNILIPIDFSENAWNAIQYALHFFGKSSCNFYLLHVNTSSKLVTQENHFSQNETPVSETLTKPAKKLLQETVKRIHDNFPKNQNHKFFTISDTNYIIDSIREQVVLNKINFIVMGTKGTSGLKKIAIGSNAGNVITKVKCATLVVPENAKYTEPKTIAFPTDFSIFYHPQTLQPILDILEVNKAAVNVLHVNKNGLELNEDQQRNKEYLTDYFTNYKHSFNFVVNKHIENAVQQFVDDKDIHLITMLAKNLNYFQRILFHPAVSEISYYKNVPFLVLH